MAMDKVAMGALIRQKLKAVQIPEGDNPDYNAYHTRVWEAISEGIIEHIKAQAEVTGSSPSGSVTGKVI